MSDCEITAGGIHADTIKANPVEGLIVEDDRDERLQKLAERTVEDLTEYEWDEIPTAAQRFLQAFWRGFFEWAVKDGYRP